MVSLCISKGTFRRACPKTDGRGYLAHSFGVDLMERPKVSVLQRHIAKLPSLSEVVAWEIFQIEHLYELDIVGWTPNGGDSRLVLFTPDCEGGSLSTSSLPPLGMIVILPCCCPPCQSSLRCNYNCSGHSLHFAVYDFCFTQSR